jgi:RNA polymerase sigma-70 factor (ECF subfamily)
MTTDRREPQPQVARPATPLVDAATFERFVDDQLEHVYAFVARRFDDRSIAEEVTTVAFRRAAEMARTGALGADDLAAFTIRVAASAVVDHARRARRSIPPGVRASDLDEADDRAAAEALSDEVAAGVFAKAIDGERLRRALTDLPDEHRRAVLLAYFDGLQPAEVATILGCAAAEVPLRLNRAMRALRQEIGEASTDAA